ncbi:MAG: type II secretion system F family protein [Candidatus Caldatribacteriota bacterium]|jgi:type IV pilus assembly protein PilC|nr:type II secretion system F family protein [Atribacterota bacterium]MDD3641695.1 type II secretion system F family protein [Atribacterota bacterium]MDD4289397.1 type II secretion system F family protein [Atribacterota bacterium]MDD4765149.1 type II secretion system F family protein [Atribacterota bacterium]MDI9597867.1 type II secretion system F family protein [Atribacterota bacterium]
MPTFTYKARDNTGKVFTGTLEGDNREVVIDRLREMKYFIISVDKKAGGLLSTEITLFQTIKIRDLAVFFRQFATMVSAGLTLVNCLEILTQQTENKLLAKKIGDIKKNIEQGATLTDAFAAHPETFSKLQINMIKAGEMGGVLDDILNRIATLMEKEYELRQKIKSAMTYPGFVMGAAVLMGIFMLTFILPQFVGVFQQFGGNLPFITQMLVNFTQLFNRYWYVFLAVIVGLVFLFISYSKTKNGHRNIDKIKLKIPVFGNLFLKTSINRFTRTLGTLIRSGVPIIQSLKVSSESIGNDILAEAVANSADRIKEGQSISAPLKESGVFPPMVTQMIMVGEESGELETMLLNVSEFYDQEVERAVEQLTSVIEPIMMAFVALGVGGMVIAMYLPIFSMVDLV